MKTKYKVAVAVFIGGLVIVPLMFWLGGFNFNQRGETAVMCGFLTLCVSLGGGLAAATFPD